MHHQEQDLQSYKLHQAAVELIEADESLLVRAQEILSNWMTLPSTASSLPLLREWESILKNKDWDMALGQDERSVQRRQASPLACILPNDTRLEIIASCKRKTLSI